MKRFIIEMPGGDSVTGLCGAEGEIPFTSPKPRIERCGDRYRMVLDFGTNNALAREHCRDLCGMPEVEVLGFSADEILKAAVLLLRGRE